MNKKILLASGCSFTFEPWCWPGPLSKSLDYDLLNVGMASQGNGLISRKVIYNVEKLLKEDYNPEDILVGIMWSGINRYDYYSNLNLDIKDWGGFTKDNNNIKNPTNIIENHYNWRIINSNWKNKECLLYYENFHTYIFSMMMTIEHILRIQLYLEKLNIKYFMSTYTDIFNDYIINDLELVYLYKLIDFSKFLPVKGCYEWVNDNYPIAGFNPPDENGVVGNHPIPFGYEKFNDEVILPYLKKNNMIYEY